MYAQNSEPRSDYREKQDGWISELYWDDKLQVTSHAIKEFQGKTDLIYIDPPFDDKEDYKRKFWAIFLKLFKENHWHIPSVDVMAILFLTNNEISLPLFNWLKGENENVILYEEKITPLFIEQKNISFIVSYNYRTIIKPEVINLMPHKIINLHTSYLPYNKGASPNIWSFIEGTPCGVTIHEIDYGIDTGNILVQKEIKYDFKIETLASSYQKSNKMIQSLFIENWDDLKNNKINAQQQKEKGTFHLSKDLEQYKEIINYNDTIEMFLNKIKNKKNNT